MFRNFNQWLGNLISNKTSTMWAFYIVLIATTYPMINTPPASLLQGIQYISSAVFQAIMLPILAYTSNLVGDKQMKLLQETHDVVLNELKFIQEEQKNEKEEKELLKQIILEIHQNINKSL